MTGLRNFSSNYLFGTILFLIALPANSFCVAKVSDHARVAEDFLSKKYKSLTPVLFDIHHIMDFSNIECFIT